MSAVLAEAPPSFSAAVSNSSIRVPVTVDARCA